MGNMRTIEFKPSGICAVHITIVLDDQERVQDLSFVGGCDGNHKGLTALIKGMTADEAKQILIDRIQKDAYHDAAVMVREVETKAKEEADKRARDIVSQAIQRCAADQVTETTVSVVALPNDDMKGRIIGREGRNIRTLETATGVDLIIDDTPEAITVSSFDPVRREVARLALEKLIQDGRIHPARIEEMIAKAQKEVNATIKAEGERAVFETNITEREVALGTWRMSCGMFSAW